jgi:hypothetical protein
MGRASLKTARSLSWKSQINELGRIYENLLTAEENYGSE